MAVEGGRIDFMFLAPLSRPLDPLLGTPWTETPLDRDPPCEQNDTQMYKHYLTTNLVADGNKKKTKDDWHKRDRSTLEMSHCQNPLLFFSLIHNLCALFSMLHNILT